MLSFLTTPRKVVSENVCLKQRIEQNEEQIQTLLNQVEVLKKEKRAQQLQLQHFM